MNRRCLLGLVILVAWVLLGPVGMAFETCAAMMALCDGGPCGVVAAVTEAWPAVGTPVLVALINPAVEAPLPVVAVRALEPPPKSFRLSA